MARRRLFFLLRAKKARLGVQSLIRLWRCKKTRKAERETSSVGDKKGKLLEHERDLWKHMWRRQKEAENQKLLEFKRNFRELLRRSKDIFIFLSCAKRLFARLSFQRRKAWAAHFRFQTLHFARCQERSIKFLAPAPFRGEKLTIDMYAREHFSLHHTTTTY